MSGGQALFAAVLAVMLVAGLFFTVWGLFGPWVAKTTRRSSSPTPSSSVGIVEFFKRYVLAQVLAVIVFLLTAWPVASLFGFIGGFAWLSVRKESRRKRRELAQITALATWVEGLKDTMAASAGITEALTISARIAPREIETEVNELVARMRTQTTSTALQQFAAAVANPAADMIVAALTLALTKQAGSLQGVLGAISQNARDIATMLQQVEAGRTEVRTQSKLAVGVIGSVMTGMILLRREALSPFDSFGGQIVLFVILALFSFSGYLMYRLGKSAPPQRVFSRVASQVYEFDEEQNA